MTGTRGARTVHVLLALFLGVVLSLSGYAVAASTGADRAVVARAVIACRTPAGALAVPRADGRCPRGSSKVRVGARGVRGPKGVRGVAGPRGAQGPGGVAFATGPIQAAPSATLPSQQALARLGYVDLRYVCWLDTDTNVTQLRFILVPGLPISLDEVVTSKVDDGAWKSEGRTKTGPADTSLDVVTPTLTSGHTLVGHVGSATIIAGTGVAATGYTLTARVTLDSDADTCSARGTLTPALG